MGPGGLITVATRVDPGMEARRGSATAPAHIRASSAHGAPILLITALDWASTARFAEECLRAGLAPAVLAPAGHPLHAVAGVRRMVLAPWRRVQQIAAAIAHVSPHLVIPGDDYVAAALDRIHARTRDTMVRTCIARSRGEVVDRAVLFNRLAQARLAARLGIPVPATEPVRRRADLLPALARVGTPAYAKFDGTWGGMGTAPIATRDEAAKVWRRIAAACSPLRAAWRNGIAFAPVRANIASGGVVQAHVPGNLVIVAAACRRGRVLAMTTARVHEQRYATGPATRVGWDELPVVRDHATRLIGAVGLSGVCGLDFILAPDGVAHFIELNPRLTPLARHACAQGDLIAALAGAGLEPGIVRSRPIEAGNGGDFAM